MAQTLKAAKKSAKKKAKKASQRLMKNRGLRVATTEPALANFIIHYSDGTTAPFSTPATDVSLPTLKARIEDRSGKEVTDIEQV